MNLCPEAREMIDVLLDGIQRTMQGNLVGVYLRGSLATGDFCPATSDIDLLAVTEQPANRAEFAQLADLHARLASLPNPYARRVEIAYVDRRAWWRFQRGQRHPTLGQGEALALSEHGSNWILERWTVRERGVALVGPDPQELVAPIPAQELCAAVSTRLVDWAEWAPEPDDPDWLLPRGHKAYVVETMCRALYTLAHGELSSKRRAVDWAREALPEPWRATVLRSQGWHGDETVDLSIVPEVRRFVRWAASDGQREVSAGHRRAEGEMGACRSMASDGRGVDG